MDKDKIIKPPPITQKKSIEETPSTYKKPKVITKISDIQRMEIEELNQYAKKLGIDHIGSLPKSQVVFEIVKAISRKPDEMLYGEGVLDPFQMTYKTKENEISI